MASVIMHQAIPSNTELALTQESSNFHGGVIGRVEQDTASSPARTDDETQETASIPPDRINEVLEHGNIDSEMNEVASTPTNQVNDAALFPANANDEMEETMSASSNQVHGTNRFSSPDISPTASPTGNSNDMVPGTPNHTMSHRDLSSPETSPPGTPDGQRMQSSTRVLPQDINIAAPPLSTPNITNQSTVQSSTLLGNFNAAVPPLLPAPNTVNQFAAPPNTLPANTNSLNFTFTRTPCTPPANGIGANRSPLPKSSSAKKSSPNTLNGATASPNSKVVAGRVAKAQRAKVAVVERKMAIWHNAEQLLGRSKSPLYADETNVFEIIRLAVAQGHLPEELSNKIGALNDEQLKMAVKDFKDDGKAGWNHPKWRLQAQMAAHARDSGKFDPLLNHRLAENWGVKMAEAEESNEV